MAGLTSAGKALETAVATAFPPDDPLRPVLDAIPPILAALEAAETRIGTDYADRVARSAALGAQQWARALVRAEVRRLLPVLAGTLGLVGLAGVAVGLLIH